MDDKLAERGRDERLARLESVWCSCVPPLPVPAETESNFSLRLRASCRRRRRSRVLPVCPAVERILEVRVGLAVPGEGRGAVE